MNPSITGVDGTNYSEQILFYEYLGMNIQHPIEYSSKRIEFGH